jgi:hypothetical protein
VFNKPWIFAFALALAAAPLASSLAADAGAPADNGSTRTTAGAKMQSGTTSSHAAGSMSPPTRTGSNSAPRNQAGGQPQQAARGTDQ